jgi:hypothetical protein
MLGISKTADHKIVLIVIPHLKQYVKLLIIDPEINYFNALKW